MLKGIDPLLSGELLKLLCNMGHGDEIAVVDANFTAYSLAAGRPVIRLDGAGLLRSVEALLSVFPLDIDVPQPVAYMQVSHMPAGYVSPLQAEVIAAVERLAGRPAPACEGIERFAFYRRVSRAVAIIQTGELAPFANFQFAKAVVSDR
jgi:L-fucose mutarotase